MTASLAHRFTAVNDTHSALNPTLVAGVVLLTSLGFFQAWLRS